MARQIFLLLHLLTALIISQLQACTPYSNKTVFYKHPSPSTHFSTGTLAFLQCSFGLEIGVGFLSSICNNGIWMPILGECRNLICSPHLPVSNATLEYTHNILYINPYSPGSVVQLNCDSGFYPYGLTIATLNDENRAKLISKSKKYAKLVEKAFSGLCKSEVCVPYTASNVKYIQPVGGGNFSSGTYAYLTCKITERPVGPMSSLCTVGVWMPPLKGCKSILCAEHEKIDNAELQYLQSTFFSEPYAPGSSVLMICNKGYYAIGFTVAYCVDGNWGPLSICAPLPR
ncbi:unnamed protein product [Dracunculus medinensis]|uniref:Sushi domain-containing protein n=1 Tax=Dracunculus medinensis TaxID=318479 RepID=A0A0N4UED0_DRAME|nr:unnamed protein product [Dracunculus medinensis]